MIQNLDKDEQIGFMYNTNGITPYPNTIEIYVGKRADMLKNEFYSKTIRPQAEKDIFYGTVDEAIKKFGENYFNKRIVIVKI